MNVTFDVETAYQLNVEEINNICHCVRCKCCYKVRSHNDGKCHCITHKVCAWLAKNNYSNRHLNAIVGFIIFMPIIIIVGGFANLFNYLIYKSFDNPEILTIDILLLLFATIIIIQVLCTGCNILCSPSRT